MRPTRNNALTLVVLPEASKGERRAFTLVELLVVIGIIAVLVGVLLPTLASARRSANSAACMSNLRQIGQTIHMYVNANKGILPYGYWNGGGNGALAGDWSLLLLNSLSGKQGTTYTDTTNQAMSLRQVFKDKLLLLGQQFTLAVRDHRWHEAIQLGETIAREFPNSRMAEEVREKMELLRERASEPEAARV